MSQFTQEQVKAGLVKSVDKAWSPKELTAIRQRWIDPDLVREWILNLDEDAVVVTNQLAQQTTTKDPLEFDPTSASVEDLTAQLIVLWVEVGEWATQEQLAALYNEEIEAQKAEQQTPPAPIVAQKVVVPNIVAPKVAARKKVVPKKK